MDVSRFTRFVPTPLADGSAPECSKCDTPVEVYYQFTSDAGIGILCSSCYENLSTAFVMEESGGLCYDCAVCNASLRGVQGRVWKLGSQGVWARVVCADCWSKPEAVKASFIHVFPGCNVIVTVYGHLYLANEIDIDIPEGLPVDPGSADYFKVIDSLVHPPYPVINVRAWQLLRGSYDAVPCTEACCRFAVRVEADQPHEVASVLVDDHGRHSMDVVFGSYEEFCTALDEWERTRDKNIAPYVNAVQVLCNRRRNCDLALMAKATDSFAVYVRLSRNLGLYYG